MALVLLEGLLTLINIYEKVKIFKIIEERKLRGIVDAPFGLKRFFSYINNPDKFWLKPSSEQLSILVWQNIQTHISRSTCSQIMP